MSKPKTKIIFLHVPKAGGSTLRQIFLDQYSNVLAKNEIHIINRTRDAKHFSGVDEGLRLNYRLLLGHLPFGMHEYLSNGFQYVSMIRNPLDRVLSDYSYSKSNKNHEAYSLINNSKMSFLEYACEYASSWHSNGQTKLFAGERFLNSECNENTFKVAIENINRYFLFVGALEKFDLSLVILKKQLGWDWPFYKKRNISNISYKASDEEKAIVNKMNTYDLRLYEFCQKKFLNVSSKKNTEAKLFAVCNVIKNKIHH